MGTLFKAAYFERLKPAIAEGVVRLANNASAGVLVIWDAVENRFYDTDMGQVVHRLDARLHNENLIESLGLPLSPHFHERLSGQGFQALVSAFFRYYFSRLPILFRCRIRHEGRIRRLSNEEVDHLARAVWQRFADTYPQTEVPNCSGEWARMERLMRWYVSRERRDDAVYSLDWLWPVIESAFPELAVANNTNGFTSTVVEGCFPMFWDALAGRYRMSMIYHATLGWFEGDLDTEEVISQMEASEARRAARRAR